MVKRIQTPRLSLLMYKADIAEGLNVSEGHIGSDAPLKTRSLNKKNCPFLRCRKAS